MGYWPHQNFVYGVMVEEYPDESAELAESLGFEVAMGDNGEAVIGFKLDSHTAVEEGYIGGRWVTKFKKDYFDKWYAEARAKMTPEVVAKLKDVSGVEDVPVKRFEK